MSFYYYWYRALQLSEKYKDCCKKKGNVKNKALKQVYKDFGNVFGKDKFEIWWKKNGNRLFGAEQDDIVREYTDGQSLDNKIAISIISDGKGILTVMGELEGVPEEWEGKYNIR